MECYRPVKVKKGGRGQERGHRKGSSQKGVTQKAERGQEGGHQERGQATVIRYCLVQVKVFPLSDTFITLQVLE
jgi:hypothetical protein